MKKIRVLVANRPRLMRDLVMATIADQPDIEIVGEVQSDTEIVDMLVERHPDFLIIAQEEAHSRPSLCDLVLERFPQVKILALAPDRNSSVFYWASLNIRANAVEPSEQGLLNVLRSKLQPVGENHDL